VEGAVWALTPTPHPHFVLVVEDVVLLPKCPPVAPQALNAA
jgi:hypothetical protein